MRKKTFLHFVVAVASITALAKNVQAQCTSDCVAHSISLNTGNDFTTSSIYAAGARDEWWQVVQVPAGSVTETPPYCAYVINSAGTGWDNEAGSMWLNVVNGPSISFNNWAGGTCTGAGSGNPFRFERTFNMCRTASVIIQMDMMSDDLIDKVSVDGVSIASYTGSYLCTPTPPPFHSPFIWGNRQIVNYPVTLTAGIHRIDVDLRNIAGLNSGINIQGTVTCVAVLPSLSKPTCAGKNQCSTIATDCFINPGFSVVYDYSDASHNCYFTATAATGLSAGSVIVGYQWTYPILPSGYATATTASPTQNFVVPDGLAGEQVEVTVVAVDSVGDTCKATYSKSAGCNGGFPVLKTVQTTGVNNVTNTNEGDITIFPNPTNDNVTVESKGAIINHIFICDITGKVLLDKACGGTNKENISLSKYPAGSYIIKVNDDVKQMIHKVD